MLLHGTLFFNLGLVIRAGIQALENIDADQWAAAQVLGADRWRFFWSVEYPQMIPSLLAALGWVFLFSFGCFGLALLLGGQMWVTVDVEIYILVTQQLDLANAALLALMTVLVTSGVVGGLVVMELRMVAPSHLKPMPRLVLIGRKGVGWGGVGCWLMAISLWGVLCAAPMLVWLFRLGQVFDNPNVMDLLIHSETWRAFWQTIAFAGLGGGMALVLGFLHAWGAHHLTQIGALRWGWGWRAACYLPWLVSPVVLGFGVLLAYAEWLDQIMLLISLYALLSYPLVARSIMGQWDQLHSYWSDAARVLGASPWGVLWRVVLPLLKPGIRSGFGWALACCLGEFAISLFLGRPEWLTLTTLAYQHLNHPGQTSQDAAFLLMSVVVVLCALAYVLFNQPNQPKKLKTKN